METQRESMVSSRLRAAAWSFLLLMILAIPSAAQPAGDYGDAPEGVRALYSGFSAGVIGRFPTEHATANSRYGLPGGHTLVTGEERLGPSVSLELGPRDDTDPDGTHNFIDDDFDNGLSGSACPLSSSGPFTPSTLVSLSVQITVAANAPAGTRYINVLIDKDHNGIWSDSGGTEWVVKDHPVNIAPGQTQTVTVGSFAITPHSSPMWTRIALSRERVVDVVPVDSTGWDGSGSFSHGEIEDYLLSHSVSSVQEASSAASAARSTATALSQASASAQARAAAAASSCSTASAIASDIAAKAAAANASASAAAASASAATASAADADASCAAVAALVLAITDACAACDCASACSSANAAAASAAAACSAAVSAAGAGASAASAARDSAQAAATAASSASSSAVIWAEACAGAVTEARSTANAISEAYAQADASANSAADAAAVAHGFGCQGNVEITALVAAIASSHAVTAAQAAASAEADATTSAEAYALALSNAAVLAQAQADAIAFADAAAKAEAAAASGASAAAFAASSAASIVSSLLHAQAAAGAGCSSGCTEEICCGVEASQFRKSSDLLTRIFSPQGTACAAELCETVPQ